MKLTTTIVECRTYAIVNHVDSDYAASIPKEAAESSPLRCSLSAGSLESRDKSYVIDVDLAENFEAACCGKHRRWRLVLVQILNGRLSLTFADLKTPMEGSEQYVGKTISFSDNVAFHVFVNRLGNVNPDEYVIEYFGVDLDGDRVASIEERRDAKYHALESIHLWNGKYYLESYCYN